MKRNNKKGFTIVELVIVIAVIAILSAVLIPTFGSIIDKANASAVQQEAANKYKEAYALDLSDGILDAKDNGTALTDTNYSVDGEVAKYTLVDTNRGFTATFDGSKWTVTEN